MKFGRHERGGIDPNKFAERCTTSGVVLSDRVKRPVFHGPHNFVCLHKGLTGKDLPKEESDFFELLSVFYFYLRQKGHHE